jgi:hypothetical protein
MAKHCTDITLTPGGKTYRLSEESDLAYVRMVPGARIEHSGPRIEFQI